MDDSTEILLVEDNPNDVELILAALSENQLADEVFVARDGEEAQGRIKTDPDLKKIPVVMLTSSREESDLLRSYNLGTNAYVVKSMRFKAFIKAVEEIGLFWGLINQSPGSMEWKA